MNQLKIHLIGNAHLDPVWLWDRHEGMNEGIATIRSILDLMDAYPEMTFIRGEAAIYDFVETWDPPSFARIRKQIDAGRWDVVGGNWIQPDTNLTGTQALHQQYRIGQGYFESRFGKRATCAWAADSFGHSAGFPDIYAQHGFSDFVFSRPNATQVKLQSDLFWWEGIHGARVLAYRMEADQWYGMERDEIPRRLDLLLEKVNQSPLGMTACFYGLGNHGGGPCARHLEDIRRWQEKHPEVELIHSGLHRLMADFRTRMHACNWDAPVFKGELNFCLRGCYSSSMQTKFAYRRAEAAVRRADATLAVAKTMDYSCAKQYYDWERMCFNAFHDILPGSSIERVTRQQIEAMHRLTDEARDTEHEQLLIFAKQIKHRSFDNLPKHHPLPQPVLLWNPHPFEVREVVKVEACLDYRPQVAMPNTYETLPVLLIDDEGESLPFQRLQPHNRFLPQFPWRMHVAAPIVLPAASWKVVYLGWFPDAPLPANQKTGMTSGEGFIASPEWKVEARVGEENVHITYKGKNLFGTPSEEGLRVRAVKDAWGSWGGHYDEEGSNDLQETVEYWTVQDTHVMGSGAWCSELWVRFANAAKTSRLDFRFTLTPDSDTVKFEGSLMWTEQSQRLKLEMPAGDYADYEVPGGVFRRKSVGEVPALRFVQVARKNDPDHLAYGFASDGFSNFNLGHGYFQTTVIRTTEYAADKAYDATKEPWLKLHDQGSLHFHCLLTANTEQLPNQAQLLENPIGTLTIPRME